MALYEITFLTKEESDPGVRAAIEEIGGSVQSESSMGRRRLAYPILKETQAVYTTFVFDAESRSLAQLDRRLRLNNDVLRHLIVVKDIVKADKEVSKAVREAIAAAEKLEDTPTEAKKETVVAAPAAEEAPAAIETVEEVTVEEAPEVTETPAEESTEEVAEEKPAKKTRAKKSANAEEATEEDRLKALEDKLGEILKD